MIQVFACGVLINKFVGEQHNVDIAMDTACAVFMLSMISQPARTYIAPTSISSGVVAADLTLGSQALYHHT